MELTLKAFLVVLLVNISYSFRLPDSVEDMSCKTVKNEDGKCMMITECKAFENFMEKQLDTQTSNMLRYFYNNCIPTVFNVLEIPTVVLKLTCQKYAVLMKKI